MSSSDGRAFTYRTRVFGLPVELDFSCSSLPPLEESYAAIPTRVSVAEDPELIGWPRGSGDRCVEQRFPDGRPGFTVDFDSRLGYLLWGEGFGHFLVAADGLTIVCQPGRSVPAWWQRLLLAQALPLAAMLRGFEPLHASGVAYRGRALALSGPSGLGKTVTALNCVLHGADFLTDDVLALESSEEGLIAHAGPPVTFVLDEESALIDQIARSGMGEIIGKSDKVHVGVERRAASARLAAIYFLGRSSSGTISFEALPAPGPSLMLSSSFNFYLRTPARLSRQLDVFARAAREVSAFRVTVAPGVPPSAAADAIEAHFETVRVAA